VAQDFTAAAEFYRVAAGGGDRRAKFNLAAVYDNGRGVPRDLAAAEFWYGEAALEGDAHAAYALGLTCETGAVRPPDSATALSWYRKAWSSGSVAAGPKIARLERAAAGPRPKTPVSADAVPKGADGELRDFIDQTGRPCQISRERR
jgi:TPR repeat protein